ncbi:hypothetical protein K4B79_02845 [Streptomyces lincolnensis]|uniref:hypothetical protein n=1 Tax=Streptomyces lincolnensis TaxID=1915 RepID=UPI001E4B7752|nr:hypothetical protein [Streptomyces lincolnensis]MCD7437156.1 hypothetical protein [Streptomyces lincolnensis]
MRLLKTKAAGVMLAAMGLTFSLSSPASAWTYGAYEGGGYGAWQQDPSGDVKGDSFQACDIKSDGYAIYVRIDIGRDGDFDSSVTTSGNYAPYCTLWKYLDLPEGTPIRMYIYKSNSSGHHNPVWKDGTA